MSDLRFGVHVAHSKEELEQSNYKIQEVARQERAMQLGISIMEKKGWREEEQDGIVYSSQDVYVFTAKELREFVRIKGGQL